MRKLVLTGMKPTGTPHLGNYLGMVHPTIQLSRQLQNEVVFLVATHHGLNSMHDPDLMFQHTKEVGATLVAAGLDTSRHHLLRQGDLPEVFELATILNAVTPKGLLDRGHAYKAVRDRNRQEKRDEDAGVNMGLYTYPILMAADILIVQADIVPVGRDQTQHVEFARDMASYFNQRYGETLKLPELFIEKDADLIPGLDGRKMSKSYGNVVPLFEDSKSLRKLIMKIKTDSKLPEEVKDPDESTIVKIYNAFATNEEREVLRARFLNGGIGYGEAKEILYNCLERELGNPREVYKDLMANPFKLENLFEESRTSLKERAQATINLVRSRVGFKKL